MRVIAVLATIALAEFAAAEEVTLEELWAVVQAQQAQIEALTDALEATQAQLTDTEEQVEVAEEQIGLTADYLAQIETSSTRGSRTHLGGYGELHYNNVDARDSENSFKEMDFHRFVLFFSHEFTDRIRFHSELELEHSLVKDTADGSNGGEVELEQAYVEMDLNENHWTRAGLFLLPIGILNETHEPNTFYGVERNDVESIIIPSTWWEGGVAAGGRYGNGLSWEAGVHSGLAMPTEGSNAFRVRSGRQKVANASAEDLAYTLRLKYTGIPGLELAGSYHHQSNPSQMDDDGLESGDLFSFHGIWSQGPFTLKGLWARWDFDGDLVESTGADRQTGWYLEPSVRLDVAGTDWGFYGRYEDLEGGRTQDRFDQWEVGFNFWPTENVVLKFDYRDRDHDLETELGRDFKAIDLGVGYQF